MIRMKFSCYNNIAVKKIKKLIITNNNVKPWNRVSKQQINKLLNWKIYQTTLNKIMTNIEHKRDQIVNRKSNRKNLLKYKIQNNSIQLDS